VGRCAGVSQVGEGGKLRSGICLRGLVRAYAAAISRVALIGSLNTRHSADRFASLGRT
jgi:hypothetical protein